MPAKGTSRQTDRDCLVCGETTRIAHLGIECCRACAVFFRRAKRGNDFTCRSITGQCEPGKGLNCKRCRFDRIITLVQRSEAQNSSRDDEPAQLEDSSIPLLENTSRPFLEHVKAQFNAMSFNRLSSELNSRPDPPHPLEINLETGPFHYADFASLVRAIRMLLTAVLEFGKTTFPEFSKLGDADKWALARNFFYRFRMFEGCYRANKIFPDDKHIYFVSQSAYAQMPFDERFLRTAPEGADITGAVAYMAKSEMCCWIKNARAEIIRVDPTEEEFIAVVVLMFWPHGDPSVSEDINRIGEKYRGEILKELHAYYRDEMGRDDYASRIGELMMLIQMFERTKDLKEQFEVMRLFNIMTDDNFIYLLQKDMPMPLMDGNVSN